MCPHLREPLQRRLHGGGRPKVRRAVPPGDAPEGQRWPHAPLRASSSRVYPPLAPDAALLSPLPRTPALAPVTQLLKVAGRRPGLHPSCLFLLLIVLIIAQREHHVPSIRGQDRTCCLF